LYELYESSLVKHTRDLIHTLTNSYSVPIFYSAIKHEYRCIISLLLRINELYIVNKNK